MTLVIKPSHQAQDEKLRRGSRFNEYKVEIVKQARKKLPSIIVSIAFLALKLFIESKLTK